MRSKILKELDKNEFLCFVLLTYPEVNDCLPQLQSSDIEKVQEVLPEYSCLNSQAQQFSGPNKQEVASS